MSKPVDMVGKVFGRLTVLKKSAPYILPSGQVQLQWACKCECGNRVTIRGVSLRSGHIKSCGCLKADELRSRTIDLKGKVFGRLTVLKKAEGKSWLCRCKCGETIEADGGNLRTGNTKSCGCLQRDRAKATGKANRIHGGTGTVIYKVWANMMRRCYDKRSERYQHYGARGIGVTKRWHIFTNFRKDIVDEIGYRPSDHHSLDRINNDKGYRPSNVRWATNSVQQKNKRSKPVLGI